VRDALEKYELIAVERAAEAGEHLRWIVIDLSPVSEIDGTAVHYWCVPVSPWHLGFVLAGSLAIQAA